MDFGEAFNALKADEKVTRRGWNGKGMWLGLQKPGSGNPMLSPFIYMCPVGGNLVPWLASQTDMLGEDWETVEVNWSVEPR